MAKKLRNWIKGLFKKKYKYSLVSDIPDLIESNFIYIIENNGYQWQIVMLCPCGCKKTLHMNLMKEHKPYWSFEIDKRKRISLSPSVHRIIGCKSHFFVRKSVIIWCQN